MFPEGLLCPSAGYLPEFGPKYAVERRTNLRGAQGQGEDHEATPAYHPHPSRDIGQRNWTMGTGLDPSACTDCSPLCVICLISWRVSAQEGFLDIFSVPACLKRYFLTLGWQIFLFVKRMLSLVPLIKQANTLKVSKNLNKFCACLPEISQRSQLKLSISEIVLIYNFSLQHLTIFSPDTDEKSENTIVF